LADPEGKLTPVQHEILAVVWDAGEAGASVAAIWEAIAARRDVARTTVLNLVDRLEKRGWLRRTRAGGAFHYVATVDRATTARLLARGFIDEYFGGSASELVLSLLGGAKPKPADLRRLRRLLDEAPAEPEPPEEEAR
jgi:predicted transcriptional regulator